MKKILWSITLLALFTMGCEKEPDPNTNNTNTTTEKTTVETLDFAELEAHSVKISLKVNRVSGDHIEKAGFILSTVPVTDAEFRVGNIFMPFDLITWYDYGIPYKQNLWDENHTYYYRACAYTSTDTIYGEIKSFTSPYTKGAGPAGGYITYDKGSYSDGWRYLEIAPFDIRATASWGSHNIDIPGADGNGGLFLASTGDGYQNTIDIINNCIDCIPAMICDTFSYGGYTDWFLPAEKELNYAIGSSGYDNTDHGTGLYKKHSYWTSTEVSATQIRIWTGTGLWSQEKNGTQRHLVRPMRRY